MSKRTLKVELGNYVPRGSQLDDAFMSKIPGYKYIIQYASSAESEIDIQLRGKFISMYYEGGSLLNLSGCSSIFFDENYFYQPTGTEFLRMTDIDRLCHKNYIERSKESKFLKEKSTEELIKYRQIALNTKQELVGQRNELINALKNATTFKEVKDIIDKMKCTMHSWKECLKNNNIRKEIVGERLVQHYLSLFNKESEKESQFIVLDLEYAISTNAIYAKDFEREKQPRIDIVAIEKSSGQVYVMELKYGMKSVDGNASAKKHHDDYLQTVGNDEKWRYFIEDIKNLLNVKQEKGIISKSVFINDAKPIFAFIMKCESLTDIVDFKIHLHEKGLSNIPTIYLLPENNYCSPLKENHILKLS